jgi:hypothetical protein
MKPKVLSVASELSRVFVAALVAAFPGVVVVSGSVIIPAAAVVPTILASRPDGLHVAARLPGVAVAVASSRSVII